MGGLVVVGHVFLHFWVESWTHLLCFLCPSSHLYKGMRFCLGLPTQAYLRMLFTHFHAMMASPIWVVTLRVCPLSGLTCFSW